MSVGKEGTAPINKRASRDQSRDAGVISPHLCQHRKGGDGEVGTAFLLRVRVSGKRALHDQ
jgi:hypothetical protein